MIENLSHKILDYPKTVVMLCLLLMGVSIYGIKFFEANNDPRIFFSEGNPDFDRFEDLEERFTSNEMISLVVRSKGGNLFTREDLAVIEELTNQAWGLDGSIRVDSITNFQHTKVDGDDLNVDFLVEDARNLTDDELEYIRGIALNEPSLKRRLISESGHAAMVVVTVIVDEGATNAPELTENARALKNAFNEKYDNVEVMLTGTVVFSEATSIARKQSFTVTLPLSMLAVIILLLIILRSFAGMVITIIVTILSIASAIGIVSMFGLTFSSVVGMGPPMILTLAVADCIHILVSYQQQKSLGATKYDALLESIRVNFQPVYLTSVTTAIGFILLNFSESEPFQVLGTLVTCGVMMAFVLSVTFLPAVIMLLPIDNFQKQRPKGKAMDRLAEFVIDKQKPLLFGGLFVVVGLIACLPLNTFNDVFNKYFDETFEVRRVNDFVMSELSGMHRIDFSIPADGERGVLKPEYLKALDKYTQWMEAQDMVVYADSFSNVIKRLNRDMNGGDESFYRIPDNQELISQYVLMYELSLPQGLGLEYQLDFGKEHSRMSVILKDRGSSFVIAFSAEAEQWMKDNLPEYMAAKGTGMDILFGKVALTNIKSVLGGAFIALTLVSILLIFALRSVRYGLLSMIPNLLPAAMAFGLWGIFNGEIGLAVSIVACMTLGIVVDDTVHFLSKYVRAKRENGLSTEDAVRYSFNTVGVALIATSIILMANFSIMGTSHFYPSSSMGILTTITIAIALIVDLFFFVPLLLWLDKQKKA